MNRNRNNENSTRPCSLMLDETEPQGLHLDGSLVPPSASTGTERAQSSNNRDSFLDNSASPQVRTSEKPTAEYSTLTPERLEFHGLYRQGRFAECRLLAERMIERGEELVAWIHDLASTAYEQGDAREAYSIYISNAHLLEAFSNPLAKAKFCNTFGMVSQKLWELHGVREYADRALYAYRQASSYYKASGHPLKIAYAENNQGWLWVSLNEPERAFEHLDKAEHLFGEAGELARVADTQDTRALAYEKLGDYRLAFECASAAVGILKDMKDVETKSFEEAKESLMRILSLL